MKRVFLLVTLAVLVAGCTQIWNASDLADWVRVQAESEGCDPQTIELADWYEARGGENVWPGACVNAQSGETMNFAIGIDAVWTPSAPPDEAPPAPDDATDDTQAVTPLSEEALKNSSYSGIYDEPITLADGAYVGDPEFLTVEYVADSARYGDLDGDGVDDAVAFLVERGGGTGAFVHVAAQLNRDGEPVDAGAVLIEDRIQVISLDIDGGVITVVVTAEGPGDAACCRSHKATQRYGLQDGKLIELPGEQTDGLERISFADLDGTLWTLVEMNYDEPTLVDAEVTAYFEDGQIQGTGGCNTYSGSFTLSEENPFVVAVGPIITTAMMCEQDVSDQESAYLSALGSATQWGYVIGQLAIYYGEAGEEPGRLLYAPAAGE